MKRVLTEKDFKIEYCPPHTHYDERYWVHVKEIIPFLIFQHRKWTAIARYTTHKEAQAGIKKMVRLSEEGVWIDP